MSAPDAVVEELDRVFDLLARHDLPAAYRQEAGAHGRSSRLMPYEFVHRRRVEFAEVDAGGVMHFANYFRFMESAEHAFFRSLGLNVFERQEGGTVAWPRIRATCSYHMPLHVYDEVDVRVIVASKRRRSVELWMAMYRGEERAALGAFRNVCVTLDPILGTMISRDIPPEVDERLQVAPPETLADLPSPWR